MKLHPRRINLQIDSQSCKLWTPCIEPLQSFLHAWTPKFILMNASQSSRALAAAQLELCQAAAAGAAAAVHPRPRRTPKHTTALFSEASSPRRRSAAGTAYSGPPSRGPGAHDELRAQERRTQWVRGVAGWGRGAPRHVQRGLHFFYQSSSEHNFCLHSGCLGVAGNGTKSSTTRP